MKLCCKNNILHIKLFTATYHIEISKIKDIYISIDTKTIDIISLANTP